VKLLSSNGFTLNAGSLYVLNGHLGTQCTLGSLYSVTSFPIAKLYSTVALKELLRPWADKNKIKNKVWECLP